MRDDSALSHLYDDELCIATLKDGTECEVRWNREGWCFFHRDTGTVCPHDDIRDWRPTAIRFDRHSSPVQPEKGVDRGQAS